MTDADFIELLNLYLDHEIGAEAAARLEAEVHRSPDRRRLYQQYCRMHKACTVLAEASKSSSADDKIVVLAAQRGMGFVPYAAGLFAAAAAAAVVFFAHAPSVDSGARFAGDRASALAVAAAPAAERAVAPTDQDGDLRPVFSARAFSAKAIGAGAAWPTDDLAWISRVQLPPIPPSPPMSSTGFDPSVATMAARPAETGPADLTAFQFQR